MVVAIISIVNLPQALAATMAITTTIIPTLARITIRRKIKAATDRITTVAVTRAVGMAVTITVETMDTAIAVAAAAAVVVEVTIVTALVVTVEVNISSVFLAIEGMYFSASSGSIALGEQYSVR